MRAVLIIDPNRKIRLSTLHPLCVGRNLDEILRDLKALQFVDEHYISPPFN